MDLVRDAQRKVERNFDSRIAFSAAVGAAGLGVVAYLLNRSNIKVLKQAANVATTGKKGGK